jgi:hypothetical protein
LLEKKRVEFLMTAKKCKRVPKSVKGKEIGQKTLAGPECFGGFEDAPSPIFLKRYDSKRVRGWVSANDMIR